MWNIAHCTLHTFSFRHEMRFNLLHLNGCVMNFLFIAILNERSMPQCRVYDQFERQHDNKTNGRIVF